MLNLCDDQNTTDTPNANTNLTVAICHDLLLRICFTSCTLTRDIPGQFFFYSIALFIFLYLDVTVTEFYSMLEETNTLGRNGFLFFSKGVQNHTLQRLVLPF